MDSLKKAARFFRKNHYGDCPSGGLEFDEVIIPAANHETYHTDADRKLLYVACTRAMHRLTLLYTGEVTELIGK